ncbi:hypothetical protein [Streptomyces sp. NPDC002758]
MPRGRHRHSPPLHRLLPPSAIAGVSLVCALGPWVFTETMVLRSLAAVAAATAVGGAFVMRRWDAQAGKQVADLERARASDDWRHEERVAELETDLEESRELRTKLEQRLRAKRAELAGLRNEHAALLRRYATAETERASALEGRRLLEIEATTPARALPPAPAAPVEAEAVAAPADTEAAEAPVIVGPPRTPDASETTEASETAEEKPTAPAVFSPEGSQLFLRAEAALSRFDNGDDETAPDASSPKGEGAEDGVTEAAAGTGAKGTRQETAEELAQEDDAQGQPAAVDGHEHAAATTTPARVLPAKPAQQPSGHFTVPTAVAVVPAAPVRRPAVEGGFDFFGMQKGTPSGALDTVHNEDLADVVGQEALALHKAESEAEFKPAHAAARGVGQVIDLTAHDETEQIDMQGLRSAAS